MNDFCTGILCNAPGNTILDCLFERINGRCGGVIGALVFLAIPKRVYFARKRDART